MLTGMPTDYESAHGQPVAITTNLHLNNDHVQAAVEAGWRIADMREA